MTRVCGTFSTTVEQMGPPEELAYPVEPDTTDEQTARGRRPVRPTATGVLVQENCLPTTPRYPLSADASAEIRHDGDGIFLRRGRRGVSLTTAELRALVDLLAPSTAQTA